MSGQFDETIKAISNGVQPRKKAEELTRISRGIPAIDDIARNMVVVVNLGQLIPPGACNSWSHSTVNWLKGGMVLLFRIPISRSDTFRSKGLVRVARIEQVHHLLRPISDLDVLRVLIAIASGDDGVGARSVLRPFMRPHDIITLRRIGSGPVGVHRIEEAMVALSSKNVTDTVESRSVAAVRSGPSTALIEPIWIKLEALVTY